ncbi:MAG: molybdopterin converting factor subunit 1 [Gammaproteobacteria bacterium CG22_combo_CG10-13_8_21_14_all_40_8]|nr:MAG: molybdopterin converting factor subunit 1 [Gammaproteobacteria bacterium CG22_combo_CG10-13_8_21_14_all_40_8]
MTITILFFAQTRERLQCSQLEWPLEQSMDVRSLIETLIAQHPHWKDILHEKLLCAVNQTLVDPLHILNAGDEVAFFPPVTGG